MNSDEYAALRERFSLERLRNAPLTDSIRMVIPFKMLEIYRNGGPSEADLDWITHPDRMRLGLEGDTMLYGSKDSGLLREFLRATALLAFIIPEGITTFGMHFCAGTVDDQGVRSGVDPAWLMAYFQEKHL